MTDTHDPDPADLHVVVDRLRACRPNPTPRELDAVKRRVFARAVRAAPPARTRWSALQRTRISIVAMLVVGFVLTTGGGVAVSHLVTDDASVAQYEERKSTGEVLGNISRLPLGQGVAALQSARQSEGGGLFDGLPFTGFLAIIAMLVGLALMARGYMLRRDAGDGGSTTT